MDNFFKFPPRLVIVLKVHDWYSESPRENNKKLFNCLKDLMSLFHSFSEAMTDKEKTIIPVLLMENKNECRKLSKILNNRWYY